jgi:hypothetical protein
MRHSHLRNQRSHIVRCHQRNHHQLRLSSPTTFEFLSMFVSHSPNFSVRLSFELFFHFVRTLEYLDIGVLLAYRRLASIGAGGFSQISIA